MRTARGCAKNRGRFESGQAHHLSSYLRSQERGSKCGDGIPLGRLVLSIILTCIFRKSGNRQADDHDDQGGGGVGGTGPPSAAWYRIS